MMELEYYSLQIAHEATGYTREYLICLGAEGKIDFYVKNLKAWAIKVENDDDYGFSKELNWLDSIEGNGNIGYIEYKGNFYVNPWLSYHVIEDNYGNVIEAFPYAEYPEGAKDSHFVPHICKIPAFTIEEYHTSKGDAHLSVLLSTDGDIVNHYYLVNTPPIPIKKVNLFISAQDVAKLKNKEVVKKNAITEPERLMWLH
jgi:hypothetical protein